MALRNSENRQKREGTPTKITISCNYTCVKGGGGGVGGGEFCIIITEHGCSIIGGQHVGSRQPGFIHVLCLGISNRAHIIIWVYTCLANLQLPRDIQQTVAVPRQDGIHPYRTHAVLSWALQHNYIYEGHHLC